MGCGGERTWNPEVIADRVRRGLDVIGNTVGGLLIRGIEYWELLPPGTEGQTLNVGASGIPEWGPGLAHEIEIGNVCPNGGLSPVFYELYSEAWATVPGAPNWSVSQGSGGAPQPSIAAVGGVITFSLTFNGNVQARQSNVNFIGGNASADNTACGVFSEVVWKGQTNGRFTTGPAIGVNGSLANLLVWDLIGNRVMNGTTSVIGSVPAVAVDDVCAVSLRLRNANTRVVECWKNGVVIASSTTVSVPTNPTPTRLGIVYRGNNVLTSGLQTLTASFGAWRGGVI